MQRIGKDPMSKYLIIESRDPYESRDAQYVYDLASALKRNGSEVTIFLVQNGVVPTRRNAEACGLGYVIEAGVTVLADNFSLRERAIGKNELIDGVRAASLSCVVDALEQGAKTIWH